MNTQSKQNVKFRRALAICISILVLVTANATASPVTFNFDGTIDSEAFNGLPAGPVAFNGNFTFDSEAANGGTGTQGSYTSLGPSFGIHIDDFGFGAFDAFSFLNVGVIASVQSYTVTGTTIGDACPAGGGSLCIDLNFIGASLADIAQPLSAPSFLTGLIDFTDQTNFEYIGTIKSLTLPVTSVPEPDTLMLLAAGALAALLAARRRVLSRSNLVHPQQQNVAKRKRRMRMGAEKIRTTASMILPALLLVGLSNVAHAVDGVVLINQSNALAGNVTPGDDPGFPVTISQSGSYRLTGNLVVPAYVDGINVNASNVTLDLNGFSIIKTGNVKFEFGIVPFTITAINNVRVSNGTIAGFPNGVALQFEGHVDNVRFIQALDQSYDEPADFYGFSLRSGTVTHSNVNSVYLLAGNPSPFIHAIGISCESHCLIANNSVTFGNTGIKIYGGIARAMVSGNLVTDFRDSGLDLVAGGYRDNVIMPSYLGGVAVTGSSINLGGNLCDAALCP